MNWACDEEREEMEVVRTVMIINVEGRRGKLKKWWLNTIESDMRAAGVCPRDVEGRDKCSSKTRVSDSK